MGEELPKAKTVPWNSGAAYLHPGEDLDDYDQLKSAVLFDLAPQDIIESIWAEDVVFLVWESHRLRRVKRAMLQIQERALLRLALREAFPYDLADDSDSLDQLMARNDNGDRNTREAVRHALAKNPVHAADPVVFAQYGALQETLAVDKAIEACDKRRDAVLSNLYSRRQLLARS